MPFTFNGIATRFYGCSEVDQDQSYVTTEWFVLLFLPIMPLKSLRVRELEGNRYAVLDELPRVQSSPVWHVYRRALVFVLAFALTLTLFLIMGWFATGIQAVIFGVIVLVEFFLFRIWVNHEA